VKHVRWNAAVEIAEIYISTASVLLMDHIC